MNLTGLYDLLGSERGVFALFTLLCATVLVIFKMMTVQMWIGYTQALAAVLIASKTVTTTAQVWADRQPKPTDLPSADVVKTS